MRPLNRPMFRYGGPIKEGIMNKMQDRPGYSFGSLVAAGGNILRGAGPFLKNIYQGIRTKPVVPFQTADTGLTSFLPRFIQKQLPSQRFRMNQPIITRSKKPTVKADGDYSPINIKPGQKLSIGQVLKDPKRIGAAIRENPILAASTPTLTYNAATMGGPIVLDAAKGFANFLVPGTRFDPFGPEKQDDIEVAEGSMTRGTGGPKNIGEISTDTDKKIRTDGEKSRINEDRINETKQKYYKLMGIDKMNKDAVYDSLIDASRIVSEEGADLKGSIKSGALQNRLIQAIGKNLDKSADLKKAIDSAVLKGEIEKDINLTKPSAFAEQVAYLRNNPNDPLARKLSGVSSVADNIAVIASEGKTLTSDIVGRLVGAKGQDVEGVIKDDKYQKWEKNNEGKDEIDYLQDVYKGKKLDEGIYIINKKAFKISVDGEVNPIDLDSIIG